MKKEKYTYLFYVYSDGVSEDGIYQTVREEDDILANIAEMRRYLRKQGCIVSKVFPIKSIKEAERLTLEYGERRARSMRWF